MNKLLRVFPILAGALLLVSICAGVAQAQQTPCSACSLILLNYQCAGVPLADTITCSNLAPDEQAACNLAAAERANNACMAAQNEAWANCVQNCVVVTQGPPPGGGGGPGGGGIHEGGHLPPDMIPPGDIGDCPEFEFLLAAVVVFGVGPRLRKRKK